MLWSWAVWKLGDVESARSWCYANREVRSSSSGLIGDSSSIQRHNTWPCHAFPSLFREQDTSFSPEGSEEPQRAARNELHQKRDKATKPVSPLNLLTTLPLKFWRCLQTGIFWPVSRQPHKLSSFIPIPTLPIISYRIVVREGDLESDFYLNLRSTIHHDCI